VTTRFERDTAVERIDTDTFRARIAPAWWVMAGPNGGYLAAIILRALTETVDDPVRAPRSLTVHYAASPSEGEVTIRTAPERVGGSLTSVSARMEQDGTLVAIAVGAFSKPRPGPTFCDLVMPDVAPAASIEETPVPDLAPPIASRWDTRWAIGRPPDESSAPSQDAVGGGWIRLEEPQVLGAPAVAAITDAWIPPVFSKLGEPFAVPTIDLTVHFRTSLPLPGAAPDDFLLAVFRSNAAMEGFLEEDGEVWSADGQLVAQSRQLAVVLPIRTRP
jgi:acyl-CoA thioesterase